MSDKGTLADTPSTQQPPPPEGTAAPAQQAAASAPVAAVETTDSTPADAAAPPAEGAAPEVVDSGAAPAAPAAAEPKKQDWRDRRIAQLTAQLKQAKQSPAVAQDDPAAAPAAPIDLDAEANRRATIIAQQNEFNRRCNEVAEKGKNKFSDFNERIGNLQHLFTPGNTAEEAAYVALLNAALETDDPERVLYELGGDMDRAEALMSMSPVKVGMEMAKIAAKQSAPEPSSTPRPIAPIGQRGQTQAEIDPADKARADNLSTRTWMERRQKYIEDQRKAGVRMA